MVSSAESAVMRESGAEGIRGVGRGARRSVSAATVLQIGADWLSRFDISEAAKIFFPAFFLFVSVLNVWCS